MPKYAARVDRNQPEIVKAIRKEGWTVLHLHTLGKGAPDILVGKDGENFLIEIKDGEKPPSKRKLTPDEAEFSEEWEGQVTTCINVKQVMDVLAHLHTRNVPPF